MGILAIVMALCLTATVTRAGCAQFGCCYCNTQSGNVIYTGRYREDCNPGYYCKCGYNDYTRTYFGVCGNRRTFNGGGCTSVAASIARDAPIAKPNSNGK